MTSAKKSKKQQLNQEQWSYVWQFHNDLTPEVRLAALKRMTKATLIMLCIQLGDQLDEQELMAGDQTKATRVIAESYKVNHVNLKKGRPLGTATIIKEAEKRKAEVNKAIADLFDDAHKKPGWGWTNKEIADYLSPFFKRQYSSKTIRRIVNIETAKIRKADKTKSGLISTKK